MWLFSFLASVVVAAASSLTPSGIAPVSDGRLALSVTETSAPGVQQTRIYSFPVSDPSAVETYDGILPDYVTLPGGVLAYAQDGPDGAYIRFSRDEGASWQNAAGRVRVPQKLEGEFRSPKVFVTGNGALRMVLSGFRTAFLYYSDSSDMGETWSLPKRMMHNPDKAFDICTMPDGTLVLVKNCRIDEVEFTKDDELYACYSRDWGETWYKTERISGEKFCDSPVCCADAEGNIFIAYRRRYQRECEVKLIALYSDGRRARYTLLEAGDAERAYLQSCGGLLEKKAISEDAVLRIVTYNTLRSSFTGGEPWKPRCKTICEHLEKFDPDFIGMQETSKDDISDLGKTLFKKYDYIAVTPEIMGPEVSRFRATSEVPLWWRKSRFTLLKKGWIEFNIINDIKCGVNVSDESWGNGQDGNKTAIWGIFLDKNTGKEVCVFNMHLPTRTEPSKLATAKMVAEEVAKVAEGRPVFITGDYNMTEEAYTFKYLENDVEYIRDAGLDVPADKRINWEFNSMYGDKPLEKKRRDSLHIDHIFYTPCNSRPISWELEYRNGSNGSHGSDHHPVLIVFEYALQ